MSESNKLDLSLRIRIIRFLHTGLEIPKYYPGCWSSHKYFELHKLVAIDEALAYLPDNLEVVDLILEAYNQGYYTRFDTLAFALAKCIKVGSELVKKATYKAAAQICQTSEELMLFTKFTMDLKTGNGRGWCKTIQGFYLNKTPLELAKEISRVKARHDRSHRTLIRKCHLKVSEGDQARDTVVKYIILGLRRTKQVIKDTEETKDVLEYITKVEALRHCENPVDAAGIITANNFSIDHVPGHLICSQEVWNAMLPQFQLDDLLQNIQRIHNMGFLTSDSETTAVLVSLLNNNEYVKKSQITPIHVYIALGNYRKQTRPLKYAQAKVAEEREQRRRTRQILDPKTGLWEWTITRRHPKEIKQWGIDKPPCPEVIAALYKLMDMSWNLTKSTGARYLITMDMRNHMFKGRHFCKPTSAAAAARRAKKEADAAAAQNATGDAEPPKPSKKRPLAECFFNNHVTPGHIALIMALHLLRREKSVTIALFANDGINIATPKNKMINMEEAETLFRNSNQGKVQLDAPIEYAMKTKKKFDVFLNIVDRPSRMMELQMNDRGGRGPAGRYGPPPPADQELPDRCPARALERYRNTMNQQASKLVVMSLATHRVSTTDGSHSGVLDIVGIDEHVPKLIDAFTLSNSFV